MFFSLARRRTLFRAFPAMWMLLTALVVSVAAPAQAQTSKDGPLTPAPVVAKQTGPGEITVTWKAVPGATGYVIGRSIAPNGYQRFRPNYPPETTLVDKDISVGVAHRYRVVALLPNDRTSEPAASNLLTPMESVPLPNPDPAPGGGSAAPGGAGTPGVNTGSTGGNTGTSGNTGGGASGGTEGGGGTTAAAARGRFRVTIAGFKVLQETYDNPTQIDGQRDEVYITASVTDLAPAPKGPVNRFFQTRTFGDIGNLNPSTSTRLQAGTSHEQGGLRNGDTYLPDPAKAAGSTDRLPLRVFDGELVQGGPAVVITPVIWEEDFKRSALDDWEKIVSSPEWRQVASPASPASVTPPPTGGGSASIQGAIVRVVRRVVYTVLTQLRQQFQAIQARTQPVASMVYAQFQQMLGKFEQAIMDRPIGLELVNGVYEFNPRVIPLTYELADVIVREQGNGTSARVEIPFEDKDPDSAKGTADPKGAVNTSRLGGRYVLYLDIERMP